MKETHIASEKTKVLGGRVHNLKNINIDIPLNKIVGIAGVSGIHSTFGTGTELLNHLHIMFSRLTFRMNIMLSKQRY